MSLGAKLPGSKDVLLARVFFVFKSWMNMTKIEVRHLASKTVFGL